MGFGIRGRYTFCSKTETSNQVLWPMYHITRECEGRSQRRRRQAHRKLVENGLAIYACSIKTINLTTSSSASQKYWGETKDANMLKPSDSPRPYERSTMQNVPADQLQTTSIDNGRSQMQLIAKSEKRKRLWKKKKREWLRQVKRRFWAKSTGRKWGNHNKGCSRRVSPRRKEKNLPPDDDANTVNLEERR